MVAILSLRLCDPCGQVWDSTTLQCKRTLEGHEDNVRVLTVGSRHVFSGSWDKTIRVWDIDTLECIKVRLACGRSLQSEGPDVQSARLPSLRHLQ